MSEFVKPQSPLYSKENDAYFYPMTTVDQVVMEDGTRLNTKLSKGLSINLDGAGVGEPNLVYADMLGGKPAEDFATKEQLNDDIVNRVIYSGGKNLWPFGDIKSGTTTSRISFNLSAGTYTFSRGTISGPFAFRLLVNADLSNENGSLLVNVGNEKSVTFTVNSKVYGINTNHTGSLGDIDTGVQLESGSIATEYEPYYEGLKALTDRGMELLWENASPTSEFASQKVSAEMSQYDGYEVGIKLYATDALKRICNVRVFGKHGAYVPAMPYSSPVKFATRYITYSDDGLSFSDASLYTAESTGSTIIANTAFIPVYIYGIKGVM